MNVVTGALGYIGKYIARQLLDSGEAVRTITTHPDKLNRFGDTVEAFPYNFDDPEKLAATLRGASTLYNTYWIRFEYGAATFQQAVRDVILTRDELRGLMDGMLTSGQALNGQTRFSE